MMVNENVMNKIDAVVDELAQKFEPVLDKIYEFVDRDWEQIADDFLTKQAHNIPCHCFYTVFMITRKRQNCQGEWGQIFIFYGYVFSRRRVY